MAETARKRKTSPWSRKAETELEHVRKSYRLLGRLIWPAKYRSAYLKIALANARDYRTSQKLAASLGQLQKQDFGSFPIADKLIGGDWRPFRVERMLTGAMRGEIGACGSFTGTLTTNLLDSSSVIFLQNADGETMRALLPSPATATEMLSQLLESWRKSAGFETNQYTSYSYNRYLDTHTSSIIFRFARPSEWANALVHPDMIDAIDAACQESAEQRPVIRLRGALIQKGVSLATAIEVDGKQRMFVPTGYLATLTGVVQRFVPRADVPQLPLAA
jgi:hypothetical protein